MSAPASSFLLPDAELSWKLWKGLAVGKGEAVDSPTDCRERSRPLFIGLPATACRTMGLMLPTANTALLPAMVESQLEKRGVHIERSPVPNYAWHLVSQSGGQSFVSVDVLVHPFPVELTVNQAVNYSPALRLASLPPGELVVIEEQGLLVLAANQNGKLWHSHVLGFAEMPVADLAREIEIAKLSLEAQEGFGVVRGVLLIGERLSLLKAEIRKFTVVPVETAPSLPANRSMNVGALPKLLPAQVHDAQKSREGRRRVISIVLLTGVLYSLLFAFAWWYLQDLEKQADELKQSVARTAGAAAEVKTTSLRYAALEPATDIQRYPLVQLAHISKLMPPSGLVLKEFETKTDQIQLRGDARDLQTAEQLLADLKNHPKLSRYTWEMNRPEMRNKVASFRITGTLGGGS